MAKNEQASHDFEIRLAAGGKESAGIAKAHLWSSTESKKRAWRGLGITWGLAVFSVFLPLAHFFLVPGLLFAGPFVFFWLRKQKGRVLDIQAACPFCQKTLAAGGFGIEWPLRVVCGGCSEPVRIDLRT